MNKGIKYELKIVKDTRKKGLSSQWFFSGMGPYKKGDFRLEDYLIEAKTTQKNSYCIKTETLQKIENSARRQSLKPAVLVNVAGSDYIILRFQDFLDLLERIKEKKGNNL